MVAASAHHPTEIRTGQTIRTQDGLGEVVSVLGRETCGGAKCVTIRARFASGDEYEYRFGTDSDEAVWVLGRYYE